jgi:predicted deacylase
VTNPLAYANQRRTGDRNLNRKLAPTDAPREFEDHVANWLCPLLAEHEILLDLHSFTAPGVPFVFMGPRDNAGRSSRSIAPRSRKRWRGGSASAVRSTAGSRPMPAASRGVRRTRRGFPTRRSISTRATASAPPNTCARSAAAR